MSTPKRGKPHDLESTDRSPKNFRWAQQYEDTILELLVREARRGNRPDFSFTPSAYRNVVKDFNIVHGTHITKKHVQSRIKTMKQHFALFYSAFNGLSGFAWNQETKMFEAEDYLWEERISENPKFERLREKSCHNWDKLYELYGDTRANGEGASSMKEKSKSIHRGLDFADLHIASDDMRCGVAAANECSSIGEHNNSKGDPPPACSPEYISTPQSVDSSRSKLKRKATLISVMQEGYKTMATSIDNLSKSLSITGEKVAGSTFDLALNTQVYEALNSLGLDEKYRVKCYTYLCSNPSKAAILVSAPTNIRVLLLDDMMHNLGDDQ